MTTEELKTELDSIQSELPSGPRVAVLGSTSFWHPQSEQTCQELGLSLAEVPGLVLLTGGVRGVGETVGRHFHAVREAKGEEIEVFHVLPQGMFTWDYGVTLFAGADMGERRQVLGRLSSLYVVVEGGPATAHETSIALRNGAKVVPLVRSGGHAGGLFGPIPRPQAVSDDDWAILSSPDASVMKVVGIVVNIIRSQATGNAV